MASLNKHDEHALQTLESIMAVGGSAAGKLSDSEVCVCRKNIFKLVVELLLHGPTTLRDSAPMIINLVYNFLSGDFCDNYKNIFDTDLVWHCIRSLLLAGSTADFERLTSDIAQALACLAVYLADDSDVGGMAGFRVFWDGCLRRLAASGDEKVVLEITNTFTEFSGAKGIDYTNNDNISGRVCCHTIVNLIQTLCGRIPHYLVSVQTP
eukprot:468424_1